MRDIKFSGKRIDNGEWVYGYLCGKEEIRVYHSYVNYTTSAWTDFQVIPESVGEYTGCHDNNGEEVYEGGIIFNTDRNEYGVVKWDEEKAMFITEYTEDKYPLWETLSNLYYLAGNIHEHRNLLKQ